MKKLKLESSHYKKLLENYEDHLKTLGYPVETQYSFTNHVKEFLHWLNTKCSLINELKESHRSQYESYLKSRKNQTQGGGLNSHSINKHYVAINNFMTYLHAHNRHLNTLHFKRLETTSNPTVLTEKEIKDLYEVSYESTRTGSYYRGQRDRAMLAIYYGCGLRLSEGVKLDLSDLDFTNQILKVRNGKNNKSRIVPIAVNCLEDLRKYIEESRDWYHYTHGTNNPNQQKENLDKEALFLNCYGRRISKYSVYKVLNKLKRRTQIEKRFSTHSLRHSIATHLLSAGMELEKIKDFLGHSSLESTQLYTHLTMSGFDNETYYEQ